MNIKILEKKYLKANDIAFVYGVSRATVYNYIKRGIFPQPRKIGQLSFFDKDEVDEYFKKALH